MYRWDRGVQSRYELFLHTQRQRPAPQRRSTTLISSILADNSSWQWRDSYVGGASAHALQRDVDGRDGVSVRSVPVLRLADDNMSDSTHSTAIFKSDRHLSLDKYRAARENALSQSVFNIAPLLCITCNSCAGSVPPRPHLSFRLQSHLLCTVEHVTFPSSSYEVHRFALVP